MTAEATETSSETEGATETTGRTETERPRENDVEAMEKALRKANKEAETLRLRVQQFEDSSKSEMEKATERANQAEARAAEAERNFLRFKVAADKGLPAKLAARLHGDTEDEMAADADELLATIAADGKPRVDFDAGARRPAPAGDDMNALVRSRMGR